VTLHREVRPVRCRALVQGGQIEGTFHLPLKTLFLDFLNRNEALFRLTNARLHGQTATMPFLALQRTATIAVIPLDGEPLEDPRGPTTARYSCAVTCLLPWGGVIDGVLDVSGAVRVSDYLHKHAGFLSLRDAVIYVRDPSGATIAEPGIPAIALHSSAVIGVSEIE
jgi:hypothetical protein